MSKVFCKDCKHFKSLDECMKNGKEIETWFNRRMEYDFPSEKNQFNDCKDYEPKPKIVSWFSNFFYKQRK